MFNKRLKLTDEVITDDIPTHLHNSSYEDNDANHVENNFPSKIKKMPPNMTDDFVEIASKADKQNYEQNKYFKPLKFPETTAKPALSKRKCAKSSNVVLRNSFKTFDRDTRELQNVCEDSAAIHHTLNVPQTLSSFNIFSRSPTEGVLKNITKILNSPKLFTTFGKNSPKNTTDANFNNNTSVEVNTTEDENDLQDDNGSIPATSPTKSIFSLLSLNSDNNDDDNDNIDVSLAKSVGSEMSVVYTTEPACVSPKNNDLPSVVSINTLSKTNNSDISSRKVTDSSTSNGKIIKKTEEYTANLNRVETRNKNLYYSADNPADVPGPSNTRFVTRNSVSSIKDDPQWNTFLDKLDHIITHKTIEFV